MKAADLIIRFRDGHITNFDFDESWPHYDRRDRGLKAVQTMLWRSYSDVHEHTLTEEGHQLSPELHELFDRCALFLRTDLEYEWPYDNFIGIGGLGIFGRILTLGLSTFLDRAIQKREEQRLTQMLVIGTEAAWPFISVTDYERHRCSL